MSTISKISACRILNMIIYYVVHLEVSLSGRLHATCIDSYGVSILEKLSALRTDSSWSTEPLVGTTAIDVSEHGVYVRERLQIS